MSFVERICEHRALIMAIAISIVVIYHFKCWVNGFPWYVGMVLQFGYIGVDLFFFLSGLGLTCSFEKNSIKVFYLHRIKRVLPSYILYGIILILFYFVNGNALSAQQILYKFCLIEYIYDHKGIDWFVSSILILYILFPILHNLVRITKEWIPILIVPAIFLLSLCYSFNWEHEAMTQRLPMFFLGIWCAHNKTDNIRIKRVFGIFTVFFIVFMVYLLLTYGIKSIIKDNGCGWGFLLTDMMTPVLLLCVFNHVTYSHIGSFLHRAYKWEGMKAIARNTLQIYYGTNLSMLSYSMIEAPYSIMTLIFLISLVFGSYLFSWITNKANLFFSVSHT